MLISVKNQPITLLDFLPANKLTPPNLNEYATPYIGESKPAQLIFIS